MQPHVPIPSAMLRSVLLEDDAWYAYLKWFNWLAHVVQTDLTYLPETLCQSESSAACREVRCCTLVMFGRGGACGLLGSHLPDPMIRMGSSFERFATPLVSVRSVMFAFGRAGRAVRGDGDFAMRWWRLVSEM